MKVRVMPHQYGYASTYWCIEYKLNWWSSWTRLTETMLYGETHLNTRYFPVLLSLSEAKQRADSLTSDSVKAWNKEQDEIFYKAQEEAKRKGAENASIHYEIKRP